MATSTSTQGIDFSLEDKRDYALAGVALLAGSIIGFATLIAPWYVFASIGQTLGVGDPVVFGLGCYVMTAIILYGWVN